MRHPAELRCGTGKWKGIPTMRMLLRSLGGLALLLTLLVVNVDSASAAHFGNSKANLVGTGDPDTGGQAIVNYSKGTGSFNGRVSVKNLTPGETDRFLVRSTTEEQLICEGTASDRGTFMCDAQGLMLRTFAVAVVRDSAGAEVASSPFERRGNCRVPDQALSQCDAPGHQP